METTGGPGAFSFRSGLNSCTSTGAAAPRRFAALALPLVAVAVLATACRTERPVPVSFPDDPRVVNGEWELSITGLGYAVERAVLDQAGRRLLLSDETANLWLYERSDDIGWVEADPGPYRTFRSSPYDELLDSLVTVTRSGMTATATAVSLADGTTSQRKFDLPAGEPELLTVGSGSLFAVFPPGEVQRQVHWWDLASGEYGGSLSVPPANDGVRRSSGGQFLSFWEVRGGTVYVLDTSDPARLRSFGLGICRSGGVGEGSADGRWFLGEDCNENLRVLDLHEESPTWRNLGVKHITPIRFARGADAIVWQDTRGRVHSLDLLAGGSRTLAEVGAPPDWFWHAQRTLTVDERNGLLTAVGADGRVHVVSLSEEPGDTALPLAELIRATLNVTATAMRSDSEHSSYEFQGTFLPDLPGAAPLPIYGHVWTSRFHDYRLGPASIPPPGLTGSARVVPAGGAEEDDALFTLSFDSLDRQATTYDGSLTDSRRGGDGEMSYMITLRAAAR